MPGNRGISTRIHLVKTSRAYMTPFHGIPFFMGESIVRESLKTGTNASETGRPSAACVSSTMTINGCRSCGTGTIVFRARHHSSGELLDHHLASRFEVFAHFAGLQKFFFSRNACFFSLLQPLLQNAVRLLLLGDLSRQSLCLLAFFIQTTLTESACQIETGRLEKYYQTDLEFFLLFSKALRVGTKGFIGSSPRSSFSAATDISAREPL